MIQATVWAMALRDISPVAKLVAIYISGNFDEATGRATPPLSLAKIAEFSCATTSAVSAALDKLACIGVKVEIMDDEFICARLPVRVCLT
jgi:hypothetical protein